MLEKLSLCDVATYASGVLSSKPPREPADACTRTHLDMTSKLLGILKSPLSRLRAISRRSDPPGGLAIRLKKSAATSCFAFDMKMLPVARWRGRSACEDGADRGCALRMDTRRLWVRRADGRDVPGKSQPLAATYMRLLGRYTDAR